MESAVRGLGRRRLLGVVAAALVAAAVICTAVAAVTVLGRGLTVNEFLTYVVLLALASLGGLVVATGCSGRYGWVLVAGAAVSVVVGFAERWVVHATVTDDTTPLAIAWLQDQWMLRFVFSLLLIPALFPDGRAVPAWRRPLQLVLAGWVLLAATYALTDRPLGNEYLDTTAPPDNPVGVLPVPMMAINIAWLAVMLASVVVGVGSVASRWRAARHVPDGEVVRRQITWLLVAFGFAGVVTALELVDVVLVEVVGLDLGLAEPLSAGRGAVMAVLVLGLALGVLRYRLDDVPRLANRAIVYAAMTVLVLGVYVAVVAGLGALLDIDRGLGLPLLATTVIAVGFSPVRDRVQRGVNGLLYGRREDPYRLLSRVAALQSGDEGNVRSVLDEVAALTARGLAVPHVAIDEHDGDRWHRIAVHGADPERHAGRITVPVHHRGRTLARIVAAGPDEDRLRAADQQMLADIAHHVAAIIAQVQLTRALHHSRKQLVVAREEERRRLRRDLHDGVGPVLASQTLQLDAILTTLDSVPAAGDATAMVRTIREQNQELVAEIRRIVLELRPPALDELGLADALAAYAGQLGRGTQLRVRVDTGPDGLGDLPAAVEAAAYRIAREGVTNVVRHADATSCHVRLERDSRRLRISISDDGCGVREVAQPGVGMTSMRERAEELGGTVTVTRSHPGTLLTADLPLRPAQEGALA